MKRQADKQRSERQFSIGDMVFLKLQPYVQSSLAPRANQKLAFKFFGLFPVIARVGKVAYKLGLPVSSSIHPVFHVSQLKLAVAPHKVIPSLPHEFDWPRFPESVLQHREVLKGDNQVKQVLIKWSGWPKEMATWEDFISVKHQFPFVPAWGQAGFQGVGNVTSSNGPPSVKPMKRQPSARLKKPSAIISGEEWVR